MSEKIKINKQCISCRDYHQIEVNESDYRDWENGMLIQDAMPYVSASERELFVSGMCEECFLAPF